MTGCFGDNVRGCSVIQIIGGKRNGECIKWFGNRVYIDGAPHMLHHVYFTNGTHRRYYVREGESLLAHLHGDTVDRVEVIG